VSSLRFNNNLRALSIQGRTLARVGAIGAETSALVSAGTGSRIGSRGSTTCSQHPSVYGPEIRRRNSAGLSVVPVVPKVPIREHHRVRPQLLIQCGWASKQAQGRAHKRAMRNV
jgi:hypothetical protein